ncbi:MAG: type IX secretion system membrane protein PorP/SprF [Cytophagaceae bacterium]
MLKYFFVFFFLFSHCLLAQDIQFSQFYSVPVFQNPAFAGSAHSVRGIAHQRIQWPRLQGKYITSFMSFDTYAAKYKSGFGIMVLKDFQGSNAISSTEVSLQYSYELNLSHSFTFRPGLQLGYVSRFVNYAEATFPHSFDDNGALSAPISISSQKVIYPDISSGGVLYSDKLWVGYAAHHLTRPNQSIYGEVARLPVAHAFTAGYNIEFGSKGDVYFAGSTSKRVLIPTVHYKFQGKSDQLDWGLYYIHGQALIGAWYRGIPIKKYSRNFRNNESIILLIGWRYQSFGLSYSYDMTISKLSTARSGGAHEINLTYIKGKYKKKKKPTKRIPCPSFYNY